MDLAELLVYLSSGLFLGWSLGANDAANVFGTAVGSRMIRFTTAAIICSVFVVLGAVIGGAGASHGLGKLGAVNALPGSFVVALAAALTVYWMTKAKLPVSTTQAIVGAIVGWNLFSGSITDMAALSRIVGTWIACPILGAVFAAVLYKITALVVHRSRLHMLRVDQFTRWGLILAGAFGAYTLGANNIANVVGVFMASSPFRDAQIGSHLTVTATQQLFLLGSIAIAVGVFTYSRRVMMTVGSSIMPLTPLGAWVAVVSHSLVLYVFSSVSLQSWLVSRGLPPIPLIPVSSSQAVIGAVIGIGLVQAGGRAARQIRWSQLVNIGSGWISTPIIAALVCYVSLFVVQNVFNQGVYRSTQFVLSQPVLDRLAVDGVPVAALAPLRNQSIDGGVAFRDAIRARAALSRRNEALVLATAEVFPLYVDEERLARLDRDEFTAKQWTALKRLGDRRFDHRWQLAEALARSSNAWKPWPATAEHRAQNRHLDEQLRYLNRSFHVTPSIEKAGGAKF